MQRLLKCWTLLILLSLLLLPSTPQGNAQSPAEPGEQAPASEMQGEQGPASELQGEQQGFGRLANFSAEASGQIRLLAGSFDPLSDPLPQGAGPPLVEEAALPADTPQYWLVQVRASRFPEVVAAVRSAGGTIAGTVPDDTYMVRATPEQRQLIAKSAAVRWTGYYQPAWRMPVAAGGRPGLLELKGEQIYRVYVFRVEPNPDAVVQALRAMAGVELVDDGGLTIDVRATSAKLASIAALPAVEWIAVRPKAVLLNKNARWVNDTGVRDVYAATAPGRLTGAGQTAAVADTGINYIEDENGRAHVAFRDCDRSGCKQADYTQVTPGNDSSEMFDVRANNTDSGGHRKMAAYFDIGNAGPQPYDPSSHGSHTAGSVTGDQGSNGTWDGHDGMAPGANLVHQNIGSTSGGLVLPDDFYTVLRQAYRPRDPASVPAKYEASDYANYVADEDARTHNNSWGLIVPVVDTGYALSLDRFVWEHEDMLVVVSAGNSGPQPGSIGSPAVAKNNLASGASANGRQPMASIDSMASFSSHGPTGDGRLGVDLATPGQIVTSVKGGSVDGYHVAQGTSMSGPLLTGFATLARQYFWDGYGPADGQGFAGGAVAGARQHNPSAALVKATMINGAVRMQGYYTGDDGNLRNLDGQWPSQGQGFGMVNLSNSLFFEGDPRNNWYYDVWRADQDAFPISGTSATRSYTMKVEPGAPLDVSLAWTDAPNLATAGSPSLVNNLDLVVTGPDGATYIGNNFNSRSNPAVAVAETPPGSASEDTTNPVERIRIAEPASGTYTVTVRAEEIINGPQGFALAASGSISSNGASFTPGPPLQVDETSSPEILDVSVDPVSADTARVTFRTTEPTTAVAVLDLGGVSNSFVDSYNLGSNGFPGLDEGTVETSEVYANKPVLGTSHEILLTGLSPGQSYQIALTATDLGDNTASQTVSHTSPRRVYQPDADDTGQLVENSVGGWRTGTQLYAGRIGSDGILGAFMFRVPEEAIDPAEITGAAIEMVSTHDWIVPYTQDPIFSVDLLDQSVEAQWGTQNYNLIASSLADARAYPETTHTRGAYQRYAFSFLCNDLDDLRQTLSTVQGGERRAAFRFTSTDMPGLGVFATEFGFNRRSAGPHLRPKLVLFTEDLYGAAPNGAPCDASTPAPTISNLGIHRAIDERAVTVSWETDVAADSLVLFREKGASDWVQVGTPERTRMHHVQVQDLDPKRRYEFVVRSTACNGASTTDTNGGAGYDFFFRTDDGTRTEHAAYNFETSAEGWSVTSAGGATSSWSRGPAGHQSDNGWHVRPYTDNSNTSLTSPAVVFDGPQVAVEFYGVFDTEPTFDFLYIEYSADGGSSWQIAKTIDGQSTSFPSYVFNDVRFANPNPGGELLIRFSFVSDVLVSSPAYTGVSVDRVSLASYSKPYMSTTTMPGPVAPPSARAAGIDPGDTRLITRPEDIRAGTGACSPGKYFPLMGGK